jgi:hypothetical protein
LPTNASSREFGRPRRNRTLPVVRSPTMAAYEPRRPTSGTTSESAPLIISTPVRLSGGCSGVASAAVRPTASTTNTPTNAATVRGLPRKTIATTAPTVTSVNTAATAGRSAASAVSPTTTTVKSARMAATAVPVRDR